MIDSEVVFVNVGMNVFILLSVWNGLLASGKKQLQ